MAQSQHIYLLNGFRLDSDARALTRGDQTIHLPKRPFEVLVYLIENRDRYVSRAELLETFWNGHDVYDDALRKCVGAVRKALDDVSQNPRFVETRWGVGYRYIGPLEEHLVRPNAPIIEIERVRGISIIVEEEEIDDAPRTIAVTAPDTSFLLRSARGSRLAAAAGVLAVTLVALSAIVVYRLTTERPQRSIAVLPLKNLTGDGSNDYLSDGITESLITALSKIDGLKVISPSSVYAFKGQDADLQQVGTRLGVAAVLEGSVRKNGEMLRIDVRLVSNSDGQVLWAGDEYDRSMTEIFAAQDEIVRSVATALKLDRQYRRPELAKTYTNNAAAYQAYLRGRYLLNKRTPDGIKQGISYLEQATQIDPNFAPAYAALADGYNVACWFLPVPADDLIANAKNAATKALALDDSLAEAHTALSNVYAHEWDMAGYEREGRLAVELGDGDARTHHNYAYCLVLSGRPDQGVSEIRRARDLDPLNVVMNIDIGEILLYARRYDDAIGALRTAIDIDPTRANAHYDLALAYERKGMEAEAVAEYMKNDALNGMNESALVSLSQGYANSGDRGFWQRRLEVEGEKERVFAVNMARLHARLGDADSAFDWLEKAYSEHSPVLIDLKIDPALEALHGDRRFKDLTDRVGL